MLYNKQLIADAGYTPEDITTFDDLKVIAQKTKAAGKTGFLIRGGICRQHRFRLPPPPAGPRRLGHR